MFLTRIQRGAIRTGIVLKTRAERLRLQYRYIIPSGIRVRTFAVSLTAVYTAMMPVLPLRVQAATSSLPGTSVEDTGEPPSTQPGLPFETIHSVRMESQVTSSLTVDTDHLADIAIGESRNTVQQEQQATEQQQQQETQKKLQLKAAAAARARQAVLVSASIPDGSVEQAVHDYAVNIFGEDQWPALRALISEESGFNPNSYNPRSGACGIFQAVPCSKMGGMDVPNQIQWGINYIKNRYGTPSAALAFHNLYGWY